MTLKDHAQAMEKARDQYDRHLLQICADRMRLQLFREKDLTGEQRMFNAGIHQAIACMFAARSLEEIPK